MTINTEHFKVIINSIEDGYLNIKGCGAKGSSVKCVDRLENLSLYEQLRLFVIKKLASCFPHFEKYLWVPIQVKIVKSDDPSISATPNQVTELFARQIDLSALDPVKKRAVDEASKVLDKYTQSLGYTQKLPPYSPQKNTKQKQHFAFNHDQTGLMDKSGWTSTTAQHGKTYAGETASEYVERMYQQSLSDSPIENIGK